jgi:sphingomyelin phosphodiesterase
MSHSNYTAVDLPGNNDSPAGPNGDHKCDAHVSLEESMYTAIKSMFPNAVFSLFTGDVVDHAVWNTSQEQNTLEINDAYKRMVSHGLTIYGTTGNHEASPVDLFPPKAVSDSAQWVYDILASE